MPSTQTPENFDFTEQEIIDACNRVNFNGFTAVTCGKCKKKANVLVGGQGWICTCEHYNVQVIHGANIPHE
ncbi:hypothetical protein KKF61_05675, partial [Patescibacteria group bacterium]|nr:hypothetical protein [Patescibacteria group bacterium]